MGFHALPDRRCPGLDVLRRVMMPDTAPRLASDWRVCWDGAEHTYSRKPHVASDRLLFFASIPVGLYRT
jgi:hypothetical protein